MCTFTFSLSHVIKVKRLKRQNEKLLERIQLLTQRNGVTVDDALQSDLLALVDEFDKQIKDNHTEGTFKRIFWEQQAQAAKLTNSRQMRWHPQMVRWCLHLKLSSGGAYTLL